MDIIGLGQNYTRIENKSGKDDLLNSQNTHNDNAGANTVTGTKVSISKQALELSDAEAVKEYALPSWLSEFITPLNDVSISSKAFNEAAANADSSKGYSSSMDYNKQVIERMNARNSMRAELKAYDKSLSSALQSTYEYIESEEIDKNSNQAKEYFLDIFLGQENLAENGKKLNVPYFS